MRTRRSRPPEPSASPEQPLAFELSPLLFPSPEQFQRKGSRWAAQLLRFRRLLIRQQIQKLGMDTALIDYEGQAIRLYTGGSGQRDLVLLHGFLDTSHVFRRVLPGLLQRFRIFLLDLPGHGDSRMPFIRSLWHLPDISSTVFRFLYHRLALRQPTLLSHSMGGLVGLHASIFAKKYHEVDLFDRLHMIAPGALLLSPEERELLRRRFFPGSKEEVRELFSHLFYSQVPELPDWALSGLLYEWSAPGFQYLAANTLEREDEVFFRPSALKTMRSPVDLYWGEEDAITPLSLGKTLRKALPSASLHTFEKAGHGLLQEKPRDFLDTFLNIRH
ncbi:MAG: alpha/beta hydrolase [Leptospiraceae bacterium]|nr:alpha/beta hydrolase [Leptospiraceae bacterium]